MNASDEASILAMVLSLVLSLRRRRPSAQG